MTVTVCASVRSLPKIEATARPPGSRIHDHIFANELAGEHNLRKGGGSASIGRSLAVIGGLGRARMISGVTHNRAKACQE